MSPATASPGGRAALPGLETLGLIGLGLVGRALGRRARDIGLAPFGIDPSPASRQEAAADGIELCHDLAALRRRCDTLMVCVYDGAQLTEVIEALLALAERPRLICHCVTAEATTSAELARRCSAAGVRFAEMPLAGSSRQIAAGQAPAWVGADSPSWQAARGLIEALASDSLHVGEPGAGANAKLATNLVLGLNRLALAEGLLLAEALGIEGKRYLELLRRSPAYSRAVDTIGARMVSADGAMVSRIGQHRKDVALMLAAAAKAGIELPLSRAHAALLDEPSQQAWLDHDNSALPELLRHRSARRR